MGREVLFGGIEDPILSQDAPITINRLTYSLDLIPGQFSVFLKLNLSCETGAYIKN